MSAPTDERIDARTRQLIEEHHYLVQHVVNQLCTRYPRHVDRDELAGAGAAGLVDAARRYDPATNVPFARYASIRIRGAIIDATRSTDWATRRTRRDARRIDETSRELEQRLGRRASDEEIAARLDVSVDDLHGARTAAAAGSVLTLDDRSGEHGGSLGDRLTEADDAWIPDASLERTEMIGSVRVALQHLDPQQRDIVERHHFGGERLRDIADELGVTEARVSQIRQEGLHAMQAYLATVYEGVPAVPAGAPGVRRRAAYVAAVASQTSWRDHLEAGAAAVHAPVRALA